MQFFKAIMTVMLKAVKFIWPLLLWTWLMRDFILGTIPVNMDTHTIYGVTKYYFNNLLNGTVPLWEPFVNIGRPFYAIAICNLFNPVTQLVPLLKILGVNYQIAFNIYIITYFFVSAWGFYLLCREWVTDKRVAYLGFVAFIFSGFGVSLFTQFTLFEIITPCIWFMYFFTRFIKDPRLPHALGCVLAVMMILSSYLPFYALTWMMVSAVVLAFIYPKGTVQAITRTWYWIVIHKRVMALSLVAILIAAAPLIAYKIIDQSGDVVSPGRHCQYVDRATCVERTLTEQGGMLYEETSRSGTAGERLDIGYLISHLDKLTYGSDSVFFLPFACYIVLFVSWARSVNRRALWLLISAFVIWLIAQGAQSPLHPWLYEHLFFIKYFRNLFFLNVFTFTLILLAIVVMLDDWLKPNSATITARKGIIISIVAALGLAVVVLARFKGVSGLQWVTLGLFGAGLIALYTPLQAMVRRHLWVWVILIVLQPINVMAHYAINAKEFAYPLPHQHTQPVFSWIRPQEPVTSAARIYQFVPYQDFFYAMSMTDSPATVGYPQSVVKNTFMLSQDKGDDALSNYARYKFITYEEPIMGQGKVIKGPGQGIEINSFTVNQLTVTTYFQQQLYLVYNDSYTRYWNVSIDGKSVNLEEANKAFKGVWVPAGTHQVRWSYNPPGGQWIYLVTTGVMALTLFIVVLSYRRLP